MQVEAFVAHAAVEALTERVLYRLAWLDEPQADTRPLPPVEHLDELAGRDGLPDEIILDNGPEGTSRAMAGNTRSEDRQIDELPGTEAAVVVHDIEDPEPAMVSELIAHEVE